MDLGRQLSIPTTGVLLVRVPREAESIGEREKEGERERERERGFKELAYAVLEAGKSESHRSG